MARKNHAIAVPIVLLLSALALTVGSAQPDDGTFYIRRAPGKRVKVVRVARTGDPAPGLPGTSFAAVTIPQVNNSGAVLFWSFLTGASPGLAIWHWTPQGSTLVAREGEQVPGMAPGVVYDWFSTRKLSDAGIMSMRADVVGPGIVRGFNDEVLLWGPPDDLRLLAQTGDPAPGTEPGIVIRTLGAFINAHGELGAAFRLRDAAGFNAGQAIYLSDGGPLQLVVRTGDPANGLGPDVWFDWFGSVLISESDMAVTCMVGVSGPGINSANDRGLWGGTADHFGFYLHQGQPAPGFDPGVTVSIVGGTATSNGPADIGEVCWVEGPPIGPTNDSVLWAGARGDLTLVAREGQQVPKAPPGVLIQFISDNNINARREVVFRGTFQGPAVKESNKRGIIFGPYADPELILRAGDAAPDVGGDAVVVIQQGGSPGDLTLNSTGDVVLWAYLAGSEVTASDDRVIWFFHHARRDWTLLARTGEAWDGKTIGPEGIHGSSFWRSGGSDSKRESFADDGTLTVNLAFTDGSEGIYLMSVQKLQLSAVGPR